MENAIDWTTFLAMIKFMGFGILVHIFKKFMLARSKKGYSFGKFVYLNWPAWIMAFAYSLIGCFLWDQGIKVYHDVTWSVAALLIGLSGGSIGKGTVKGLTILMSKINLK